MPTYNYLPGVIINTIDGGLVSPAVPQDDSILILGTAGTGPINTPFQVTDRGVSFNTFGAAGSLERSIEECALYSDNITAYRIGASPMVLAGVGAVAAATTTATGTSGTDTITVVSPTGAVEGARSLELESRLAPRLTQ
jgi:hypothetical protein